MARQPTRRAVTWRDVCVGDDLAKEVVAPEPWPDQQRVLSDRAEQRARRLLALEDRMDVAREPRLAPRHALADEPPESPQPVADDVVVVLTPRIPRDAPPQRSIARAVHAVGTPVVVAVADRDHRPRPAQQRAHVARLGGALRDPVHLAVLSVGDPALEHLAMRALRGARHAHQRETQLARPRFDRVAQLGRVVGGRLGGAHAADSLWRMRRIGAPC